MMQVGGFHEYISSTSVNRGNVIRTLGGGGS